MTFPTDTLQQKIEIITYFKPFLAGENTSGIRLHCFQNTNLLPYMWIVFILFQIIDRQIQEEELEVIGVSKKMASSSFLTVAWTTMLSRPISMQVTLTTW